MAIVNKIMTAILLHPAYEAATMKIDGPTEAEICTIKQRSEIHWH